MPIKGKRIELYIGIDAEGTIEYTPVGVYWAEKVESTNGYKSGKITAVSYMPNLAEPYIPGITLPASPGDVLDDLCNQYNIDLAETYTFPDVDVTAIECTAKEMLGYIAGLLGASARFDSEGNLKLVRYTPANYTINRSVQVMGGFEATAESSERIGSITTGTEDNIITVGAGLNITFSNPFINSGTAVSLLSSLSSFDFLPSKVAWRGCPAVEVGDVISVETAPGEYADVAIMAQSIKISGGLSFVSYCYQTNSEGIVVSLTPTEKKIAAAMTRLEQAIADATRLINGASGGIFRVLDSNNDGINDGFEIAQNADAAIGGGYLRANYAGIGISNNGGQSYITAMTANGINAAAVTTGMMSAQRIQVYSEQSLDDFFKVEAYTDENNEQHIQIVLQAGNSDIVLRERNDRIEFISRRTNKAVMYLTNNSFKLVDLDHFQVGKMRIYPRASGNTTFDFSSTN